MTNGNELTRASVRDQLGNIDQIREILFGSQLRGYSDRVEQIETRLSVLQQEARDRSEEVRHILLTQVHAAFEELERNVKSMNLKDSDEKIELRQQIDRLSKQLADRANALGEAIDDSMDSLRRDFSTSREKLEEDVRSLRQQVFEDLNQRLTALTRTKTAKEEMADMLLGLGTRLKQPSPLNRGTAPATASPHTQTGSAGNGTVASEADLLQALASLTNSDEPTA